MWRYRRNNQEAKTFKRTHIDRKRRELLTFEILTVARTINTSSLITISAKPISRPAIYSSISKPVVIRRRFRNERSISYNEMYLRTKPLDYSTYARKTYNINALSN